MTTCSLTQFAAQHRASKQAATKWKTRGVLVFSGDLVDVEASDRRMRDAGLGRFRQESTDATPVDAQRGSVDTRDRPVDRRPPRVDAPAAIETGDDDPVGVDDFLADLALGRFRPQVDAQKIKENALAARQLLNLRRDSGELIEIERASTLFFELARQQRDAWLTWPTRIGPMVAADLGVDTAKVVETLTAHVQEQLEAIGEPGPDFTEG
jgi:hypothetical protein